MIRLHVCGREAPGCFIVTRANSAGEHWTSDPEHSRLFQTDWDWPSLARTFGWSIAYDGGLCCEHDGTDGTIDCPSCGRSAAAFIDSAAEWLRYHDGAEAQDPGYFDN